MKLTLLPKYKAICGGACRGDSRLPHTVHKDPHMQHKSCLQAPLEHEKCVKSYCN